MHIADAGQSDMNSALRCTSGGALWRSITRNPSRSKYSRAVVVSKISSLTLASRASPSSSATTRPPKPPLRSRGTTATDLSSATSPNRCNAPTVTSSSASSVPTTKCSFASSRSSVADGWLQEVPECVLGRGASQCGSAHASDQADPGAQHLRAPLEEAVWPCLSCFETISSVPYTVLSPVVRNVSHCTPWGSSIQDFSLSE